MTIIRLFRMGKKRQPFYKIVVTDKRNAPSAGRFIEEVGFYNPITKEKSFKIERIKDWLSKGAQTSDTVHNLFVTEKIIEGNKISKHGVSKKKKETEEKKEVKAEEKAPETITEKKEEVSVEKKEEKESVTEKVVEDKKEPEVNNAVDEKKEEKPAEEQKTEEVKEDKSEEKEEKPAKPDSEKEEDTKQE